METAPAQAERRSITGDSVFRYTCGVAWKKTKALSDRALQLVGSDGPAPGRDGHDHNTAYAVLCDVAQFLEDSRWTEVPENMVDAPETAAPFAVMLAATSIDRYVSEETQRQPAPPPVPNLNRPWWAHFMAGQGMPDLEAWHEEVLNLREKSDEEHDAARWVTLDARPHGCTTAEDMRRGSVAGHSQSTAEVVEL